MLTIGLTGGIASGKTSVANWFAARAIPIINADTTAHELMEQSAVISMLEQEFGREIIKDGKVNRALLGSRVFSDPKAKKRLEKIIHPLIRQSMQEKLASLQKQNHKLIILDIPLLFEVGWDKYVDQVWVVYVSPAIQRERLMARNGFTEQEAELRIASQMPIKEKAKRADLIIDNSGTWEQTEEYLNNLWSKLIIS
ncbi:MAG: dephospho-CoA kinase [Peptococcaceae bacterium]|jgi:dephospho-CoA kinase|nr:dephospho-CoA kinase [Peptococcaceae bacterium]